MKDLMYQVWPDGDQLWRWAVFSLSVSVVRTSKRAFLKREDAEEDAKRFLERFD